MTNFAKISLISVMLVVVSACIGTGIFFTPPEIARILPDPTWILFIWTLGFLHAFAGAFVFGRLAIMQPGVAGMPFFLQNAYGGAAGFIYGWTYLVFLIPGLLAAFAIGLVRYVAPASTLWEVKLSSAAIILLVTLVNMTGLKPSTSWNSLLTWLKIAGLLLVCVAGFHFRGNSPLIGGVFNKEFPGLNQLGLAFVGVAYSFSGIQYGTFLLHTIRDRGHRITLAFLGGISIVGLLYLLVNISYMYVLPPAELALVRSPAAFILEKSPLTGYTIFLIITISVVGSLSAIVLSVPRMIHELQDKKLFTLPHLIRLRQTFGERLFPALLCLIAWIWITFWDTFYLILQHVVLGEVIFKILVMVSLFRRTAVNPGFAYSAAAIFHTSISLGMAIVLCVQRPLTLLVTASVFLAGFLLYWFQQTGSSTVMRKMD
jgi:basic amino acid/polyamine antiporter, APA family